MSTTTKIVTGVDYVGIPTNDIETAREFYETVLGLEASSVWQRPGEEAVGAEFETGTVTIALINCPGLGIPFSPNPAPLALQVEDVAAARAELESRGVTFLGDHDRLRRLPHGQLQGPRRQRDHAASPLRPQGLNRHGQDATSSTTSSSPVDVRVGERDARARALEEQVHARVADAQVA